MVFTTEYSSPLGEITLACDEMAIIGLWFNGQRHFANILPENKKQEETPLLRQAKQWLDIRTSGRCRTVPPHRLLLQPRCRS